MPELRLTNFANGEQNSNVANRNLVINITKKIFFKQVVICAAKKW
jgi:hypothetical protein